MANNVVMTPADVNPIADQGKVRYHAHTVPPYDTYQPRYQDQPSPALSEIAELHCTWPGAWDEAS